MDLTTPTPGGLTYGDAAPMLASVVDNGICSDDSRVLVRTNQATKMTLDLLMPVGGMATYNVRAFKATFQAGRNKILNAFPTPVSLPVELPPMAPANLPLPGTTFRMTILAADAMPLADVVSTTVVGSTYLNVLQHLKGQLDALLSVQGFVFTNEDTNLNTIHMKIEHGSDFQLVTWNQTIPPNDEAVVTGMAPDPLELVYGDDAEVVTVGALVAFTLINQQTVVQTFVPTVLSDEPYLLLPPQLENCIEAVVVEGQVHGQKDIAQGWYEIVNNSVFLDPEQAHDNPLVDKGLWPDSVDNQVLRRLYSYPGLEPANALVQVTGAKRFIPLKTDDDYLIVQNIEALKLMILSIERGENAAPDESMKYLQMATNLFQAEAKKHLIDPRNYMRRKAAYQEDIVTFVENTLGWVRAGIALDIPAALRTGKIDLTWSINQIERRIMQRGIFKDCVIQLQTNVVGGFVYFPLNVGSVLACDLDGRPIPIRSQFFQSLDNGPGMFPVYSMLIDQGDEYFPGTQTTRRKYKLIADCNEGQCLSAVCKLRWQYKNPTDMMVIKNYEAIRLMMTAKFMEEDEKWNEAGVNQQQAFTVLEAELRDYLAGIRHTVHVQTDGFGLARVGGAL